MDMTFSDVYGIAFPRDPAVFYPCWSRHAFGVSKPHMTVLTTDDEYFLCIVDDFGNLVAVEEFHPYF